MCDAGGMTGGMVTCGWKVRGGPMCGQPAPYVRDCGPGYHSAALRMQPVCEIHRRMLDSINKPRYTDEAGQDGVAPASGGITAGGGCYSGDDPRPTS